MYYVYSKSEQKKPFGISSLSCLNESNSSLSAWESLDAALEYMESDPYSTLDGDWITTHRLIEGKEIDLLAKRQIETKEELVKTQTEKTIWKVKEIK